MLLTKEEFFENLRKTLTAAEDMVFRESGEDHAEGWWDEVKELIEDEIPEWEED